MAAPTYAAVAAALEAAGLVARGGFHPDPADAVPALADGAPAATLVLAGDAGGRMWPAFAAARPDDPHPLDAWTRATVDRVAAALGARPLYPFEGPPYHPFQRWAQRAEPAAPSPLGVLIHPDHGLWHAYRAALVFAARLEDVPPRADRPAPCATCAGRPCLATCPVSAFTDAGYDVERCVDHITSPAGRACREGGCLARRACPVGRPYGPAQQAFHMQAFVRSRLRAREGRG